MFSTDSQKGQKNVKVLNSRDLIKSLEGPKIEEVMLGPLEEKIASEADLMGVSTISLIRVIAREWLDRRKTRGSN